MISQHPSHIRARSEDPDLYPHRIEALTNENKALQHFVRVYLKQIEDLKRDHQKMIQALKEENSALSKEIDSLKNIISSLHSKLSSQYAFKMRWT